MTRGQVRCASAAPLPAGVLVRVTTELRSLFHGEVASVNGRFSCRYPDDFPTAQAVPGSVLFIDATTAADFDTHRAGHLQAEVAVIVHRGKDGMPGTALASSLRPAGQRRAPRSGERRVAGRSARWPTSTCAAARRGWFTWGGRISIWPSADLALVQEQPHPLRIRPSRPRLVEAARASGGAHLLAVGLEHLVQLQQRSPAGRQPRQSPPPRTISPTLSPTTSPTSSSWS